MKHSDIDDQKRKLRAELSKTRAAIQPQQRQAAAHALAQHASQWLGALMPAEVSGYSAMGTEIDPLPLMASLADRGAKLSLPRITEDRNSIRFLRWSPADDLMEGIWGIREPYPDRPEVSPSILLVPLLAFDREGHRLGYGGGYYDRALSSLRRQGSITAIGIAFDEQEVDSVHRLDYDERLDWVLTPSGPRKVSGD